MEDNTRIRLCTTTDLSGTSARLNLDFTRLFGAAQFADMIFGLGAFKFPLCEIRYFSLILISVLKASSFCYSIRQLLTVFTPSYDWYLV